jgi:hypothetical protein
MSGLLEIVNHDVNHPLKFQYKYKNVVTEYMERN